MEKYKATLVRLQEFFLRESASSVTRERAEAFKKWYESRINPSTLNGHASREPKAAQILLLSAQGYKDQMLAERVGVSVATVERTRQKFVQQGLDEAITEKPRPGKPCKLDGKTEAFLIATACSDVVMHQKGERTGQCNC